MRMRQWLLLGLAPAILLGCGTKETVPDARIAHLPAQGKAALITAKRNVSVAQTNLSSAKVAEDEAGQFLQLSNTELSSAQSRMKSAQKGVELGKSTYSPRGTMAAKQQLELAQQQVTAAQAKKQYAEKLLDLRKARVSEQDAALRLAQADYETAAMDQLQRYNMANGIDRNKFAKQQQQAEEQVAKERLKVAQLEGTVASLRTTWLQKQNRYNVASRNMPPPIPAPPAPSRVPQPDMQQPGGAQGGQQMQQQGGGQ